MLGLVLGHLSPSGGPVGAILVRPGVLLLVLVFVIVVLVLVRVAVLPLLLSLGQSLGVRKLLCAMQMRIARETNSGVQFAMA